MASHNDDRLTKKLLLGLDGDRVSYYEFLSELTDLLRRYIRRWLIRWGRADSEAEDIVQEVLIAIHERRHTYERDVPVTAWVYAIARYKMIDFLRATNKDKKLVALEEAVNQVAFGREELETPLALHRLLSALPEHFRQPIVLTKLYGLSIKETAARTGTSKASVKVNIHRGMKALFSLVEKNR